MDATNDAAVGHGLGTAAWWAEAVRQWDTDGLRTFASGLLDARFNAQWFADFGDDIDYYGPGPFCPVSAACRELRRRNSLAAKLGATPTRDLEAVLADLGL